MKFQNASMISLFSKRGSYQSMFDISSRGYVELKLIKTFFNTVFPFM